MKKPLLISTVAALTIANTGVVGLASTLDDPRQEAEHVIINQLPVDEQGIQQRGPVYANEFLAAFRQLSGAYEQAFKQGEADGQKGCRRSIGGSLAGVAYQRGWERGRRLAFGNNAGDSSTQATGPETPATATDPSLAPAADSTIDQGEYTIQEPTNGQRTFINRLATAAQQIGAEYDLYPSVIIAQAALESDWGNSRLGRAPFHNLFGVKGYFAGRTTSQPTSEYQDGHHLMIVDNFRRYQNDYEALRDYAQTLEAPLYHDVHRQYAKSYRQATHALQGRYATDPQYEQKLNRLIDGYQLTRYDHRPRRSGVAHQLPVKVKLAKDQAPREVQHTEPPYKHAKRHHFSTAISVVGGLGSAGLVEFVRRIFLK